MDALTQWNRAGSWKKAVNKVSEAQDPIFWLHVYNLPNSWSFPKYRYIRDWALVSRVTVFDVVFSFLEGNTS